MRGSETAQRFFEDTRLLVMNGPQVEHQRLKDWPDWFEKGDVLVINRSATLPAAFRLMRQGQMIELRLAAFQGPSAQSLTHWQAIVLGEGDWRMTTEERGPAPQLSEGERLVVGPDLTAVVERVEGRLLKLYWESPDLLPALYRHGKLIQYAYHQRELEIWDPQTPFAGPPISVEPPSAGLNLSWELLTQLKSRGVTVATLLHSAGLSSTGDLELDQRLPFDEWYDIPAETVSHIHVAQAHGHRVIALGTTVLRALESAAETGTLQAGMGMSQLHLRPGHAFQVVNALLTGMHEPGSSHLDLVKAMCHCDADQAYQEAEAQGYRGHEYGDLSFVHLPLDV